MRMSIIRASTEHNSRPIRSKLHVDLQSNRVPKETLHKFAIHRQKLTVFIEAKLGSDVNLVTTVESSKYSRSLWRPRYSPRVYCITALVDACRQWRSRIEAGSGYHRKSGSELCGTQS